MAIEGFDEVFTGAVPNADPEPVQIVEAPEAVEAPEQPNPEPQPEPVPQVQTQPDHTVPLPKYLDTRDELKEAKRRLAEYEAKQAPAPERPDPIDDPDRFTDYLEQQLNGRLFAQKLEISNEMAVEKHGQETTEAAVNWAAERAKSDPTFSAQFANQKNPVDWIVRQHKREAMLSDIGDNVDDWFTREAAKRGYAPTPDPAAVADLQPSATLEKPALKAPPRSIASDATAPARNVDPLAEFNAIFSTR